jgi:hypothetical protein
VDVAIVQGKFHVQNDDHPNLVKRNHLRHLKQPKWSVPNSNAARQSVEVAQLFFLSKEGLSQCQCQAETNAIEWNEDPF